MSKGAAAIVYYAPPSVSVEESETQAGLDVHIAFSMDKQRFERNARWLAFPLAFVLIGLLFYRLGLARSVIRIDDEHIVVSGVLRNHTYPVEALIRIRTEQVAFLPSTRHESILIFDLVQTRAVVRRVFVANADALYTRAYRVQI